MKLANASNLYLSILAALLIFLACNSTVETHAESSRLDVMSMFIPSGWMGDGEQGQRYIAFADGWRKGCYSEPVCVRVSYKPGPAGWGGIYWQNKPDNWGDRPGEDFKRAGYKKLTFWAKGDAGAEVVEFKAGGIDSPGKRYRDSFEKTTGKVVLTKEWKQYTLDLSEEDLSSVIGGFAWIATESANVDGATFYLDDVFYER